MAQAPAYTVQIYAGEVVGSVLLEPVPLGQRQIVRCIDVVRQAAAQTNFKAGIETVNWFYSVYINPADVQEHAQWQGRAALNPGDRLFLTADSPVYVQITGYLLSAA